ncbi:rod-determining factor RdfA [Salinirubrum litoreum]|uniref:Rod-determining factor RdfA n=1 Tax=Salinirubrum litoreum TaxID=1126234 RepID=A0ABD5RGB2_9EURY|nr:rod-determining factor RdfA [Salinirubrum litoreum]
MSDDTDDGVSTGQQGGKVRRVIDRYGLEAAGEELERYWLGEDVDRRSLRDLADYLNRRIVRAAMTDAGLNPLDGEAANTYRLLTDDDVTSGERTKVERHLNRAGIDVEQLRKDFVSHQAVHTYLRKHRGVSLSSDPEEPPREKAVNTIRRLNSRSKAVSEKTVDSLRNQDEVTIGTYRITVDTRIVCRECNSQYDLTEFLQTGHCNCVED